MERALADHVRCGEWLDLAGNEPVDEAAMRSWGDDRTCRAFVIRDILRGRLVTDPDPHGLRLRGARITGRLDLENLTTAVGVELEDCFLEEGVLARDARMAGVGLTRCRLEHPTEPPLDATRLSCSVLNLNEATIIGHAERGAVNLRGAHIGGQLECDGATVGNDSGPALVADRLQAGQSMVLCGGFTATGSGENGAVRLLGAHIGGLLNCTGATLTNKSGPALDAEGLQVGRGMFLRGGFTATGGGAGVVVDLTDTRVGGALLLELDGLQHATDAGRRLAVEGLTYAGVPGLVSAREWVWLLRDGTPSYAAQPYQQLAAGYQALGDDRQARQILMAQRDDQLARTDPRWPERLWGKITKVTLGYGYQPWRALLFLAGVLVLSCVLAVVLGSHGALAQVKGTVVTDRSCTVVQQVSVGLDLNLPVGTTLARAGCGLAGNPASATASWLAVAGWLLRLLAWAFAALFVAGFTSAVRKT